MTCFFSRECIMISTHATLRPIQLPNRRLQFDDLQFQLSPPDTDIDRLELFTERAVQFLHRNQQRPDTVNRRIAVSRNRVIKEFGISDFFGLHLVYSSDQLGKDLLACYSIGLDDQGVKLSGRLPDAFGSDILIRRDVRPKYGLGQLLLKTLLLDAEEWACAEEATCTLGVFVSDTRLILDMRYLGFTRASRSTNTCSLGPCTLFTKGFAPSNS
jgi:hypothetical protein